MNPYEQLKAICESDKLPIKLLIICQDSTRRLRALDFALNSICKGISPESIIKLDGASLDIEAIRALKDSTLNLSLFSNEKTYLIKNLDKVASSGSEDLKKILSDPNSVNNFICSANEITSKSWVTKAFSQNEIVNFELLQGENLTKWILQELKRSGITEANIELARIVSAISSEDCDKASALIEKLSLLSENGKLEKSDLKNFEEFKEKVEEFQFVNMIAVNKKTQALSYIKKLETQSVSAFPLLGLLSKMISNYLGIKLAKNKRLPPQEIQKILAISPWALKKQSETSDSANEKKLIRAIQAIARADSQIKGKNLGESQVLIEMIANI